MPTLTNPNAWGESLILRDACEWVIRSYAIQVLDEAPFTIWSLTPELTYQKRQIFAKKAIENPKLYTDILADMVEYLEPNFVFNRTNSWQDIYRYLISDNPAGRNVMEMKYEQANWNHVGSQSGQSLFDKMSGVSGQDYA